MIGDRVWSKFSLFLVAAVLFGCLPASGVGGRGMPADTQEDRQSMSVPKVYENFTKLQILCTVQADRGIDYAQETQLCEAIRSVAAIDAPVDVIVIAPGDPKVLASDALTLIAHAGRDDDALAVSIRPYRMSNGSSDVLFGARPFTVPVGKTDLLRERIAAALDEVLPWRARGRQPRPIN